MTTLTNTIRFAAAWANLHRRWCGFWVSVAMFAGLFANASPFTFVVIGGAPALIEFLWHRWSPESYDRIVSTPGRIRPWKKFFRRYWATISEDCALSRNRGGAVDAPSLLRLAVTDQGLELVVRARNGQTVEELNRAAPRIASTLGAVSVQTRPAEGTLAGCATVMNLVMTDVLTAPVAAIEPSEFSIDDVRVGRTQAGGDWRLPLRGSHTLVAGCSGSGKGSVLWGICCALAPAVRSDVVRLWGIDLKRGVELAMGSALFSAHAYTADDALQVLRELLVVIDNRGAALAGRMRLHEPAPGDPLHVLVIDELAALTAYSDPKTRREAERLLGEILTQGRALGVVVVACVQDPRKDIIAMRGLFTRTVALRLRSAEETTMVLGEGMAHLAPAHQISSAHPGTAWIVEDTGAVDRVRADFWPDDVIRSVSAQFATPVRTTPLTDATGGEAA